MQTEYPEKYKMLGLRIAYFRKKEGYTQEVFAEKMEACAEAAKRFGFTAEAFAAKRAEFETEFAAFYADKKTVAALMACSH